jgi:hypothetical protein
VLSPPITILLDSCSRSLRSAPSRRALSNLAAQVPRWPKASLAFALSHCHHLGPLHWPSLSRPNLLLWPSHYLSEISFSDIQERGWCPSSYNCAAKRGTSVYSELSWVGISKLLNGKAFACNLLNKLCSYDICNNHHYLRLQVMESVFMWIEHINQGEMDRYIRRWNMLLAQHIESKLQWITSVHDECEPQLWNLQPVCSLSWLLVLLDELVVWLLIRPLMNWCLTFLNFFSENSSNFNFQKQQPQTP